MRRLDELWYRLNSIEALRMLKKHMSYEKLSSILGLPPAVLSRYVNGHVLPSPEKSRAIIAAFKREFLLDEVKRRLARDEVGAIDTSEIIHDPLILKQIVLAELEKLMGFKVDRVMTMESDGIPVAYQLASILGVGLAIARKSKKIGVRDFVEVKQIFESGAYRYIYLPKGLVKKGEYVLLVDDIIRTGGTMRAMITLCKELKANISGMFSIIALRGVKEKLMEEFNIPIESFITI
ncbi:MAG: helix-turn-helix domain-containing protein [Thaumarchaeota archaeon]|nr:helix-turn-helix domain-containing protein [Nitrososphaerota archaeon]MCL7386032.1 helix-turn-helix domain-containing protein [Candidatus Wolframiiraptor allenii]MCL7393982.1 helix-turn-helix domain-containing protein [Candidatus Wolframiiraptor allenii]